MMDLSWLTLSLVVFSYLLAGTVKGVIGMGLPTVVLGILAAVITPAQAAAILIAPSLATNVWQMVSGPYLLALLKRLGPMLIGMAVGAWLCRGILTGANAKPAEIALSLALIGYAIFGLMNVKFSVARHLEIWVGPLVGLATGGIMAATGIFMFPALPYMQAIGLQRDELVQALGVHFTVSTVFLALVLWDGGIFNMSLGVLSLCAIAPAVVGMYLGQRIRKRISIEAFRLCFFLGIAALGAHLLIKNVM